MERQKDQLQSDLVSLHAVASEMNGGDDGDDDDDDDDNGGGGSVLGATNGAAVGDPALSGGGAAAATTPTTTTTTTGAKVPGKKAKLQQQFESLKSQKSLLVAQLRNHRSTLNDVLIPRAKKKALAENRLFKVRTRSKGLK